MAAEELDPGARGMHRHLMAFDGIAHELVCRQTTSGQVPAWRRVLSANVPLARPDEERSIRQSLELVPSGAIRFACGTSVSALDNKHQGQVIARAHVGAAAPGCLPGHASERRELGAADADAAIRPLAS